MNTNNPAFIGLFKSKWPIWAPPFDDLVRPQKSTMHVKLTKFRALFQELDRKSYGVYYPQWAFSPHVLVHSMCYHVLHLLKCCRCLQQHYFQLSFLLCAHEAGWTGRQNFILLAYCIGWLCCRCWLSKMFILACVPTRHYRDYLNASILVVSDFGRLKKTVARLQKDVVAPYAHVVHTYEQDSALDPFSERKTLLFFQGRISRKDVCNKFDLPQQVPLGF